MKSKILAFKNNRQSYKFAQHLNEHMHTFRSLDLKWSEVEWSEVKWSEVKLIVVYRRGKITLWEHFTWVIKWWEVKGWGESVIKFFVGKITRTM